MTFEPHLEPPDEPNGPSLWFAFRGNKLLVDTSPPELTVPIIDDLRELGVEVVRRQYLGRVAGVHVYSAELAGDAEAPDGYDFDDLRRLFGELDEGHLWLAGRAVQIVDWDRSHQFCGRCGHETELKAGERARKCTHCGLVHYPRLAPAIIVAVVRGDKILLARSRRHRPGFYSVLAGFVEPGETLEECIRREVYEEVGLLVSDIQYFGSQPWPFPNSLMIAFTARSESGEIFLRDEEIEEAAWYAADALPGIPGRISIARRLIDWFVAQQSV